MYDIIILGAGPAGLSAGIYAARAKFRTLILEKEKIGGQITITDEVVNYPGVLKTTGSDLTEQMRQQAEFFGAEILLEEVLEVDFSKEVKIIRTNQGEHKSLGVIIATGSNPRMLGFPGEEKFKGRGIAYCATCDGEFFAGMDVFVVGAGFAAAEEAVFLTKYAKKVTIIAREPEFTCAKAVAQKALEHEKILVQFNTEVVRVEGDKKLEKAVFRNNQTGKTWEYVVQEGELGFGMFIFVGYAPASEQFANHIELDKYKYIVTDANLQTNKEGVFAAGDICIKPLRQVVTAVSDGALAATNLEKYVEERHQKYRKEIEEVEGKQKQHSGRSITTAPEKFIDSQMREKLQPILKELQKEVKVIGMLDESSLSTEMYVFLEEIGELDKKIKVSIYKMGEETKWSKYVSLYPSIVIADEESTYTRIQFHGVPGGHEFSSFILAIYNVSGAKKAIGDEVWKRIQNLKKRFDIKVAVSLSCTLCPEVVMECQRIALENKNVEAHMLDLSKYPEVKEKYGIMSVPCMIINEEEVYFGKKSLEDIIDILETL